MGFLLDDGYTWLSGFFVFDTGWGGREDRRGVLKDLELHVLLQGDALLHLDDIQVLLLCEELLFLYEGVRIETPDLRLAS